MAIYKWVRSSDLSTILTNENYEYNGQKFGRLDSVIRAFEIQANGNDATRRSLLNGIGVKEVDRIIDDSSYTGGPFTIEDTPTQVDQGTYVTHTFIKRNASSGEKDTRADSEIRNPNAQMVKLILNTLIPIINDLRAVKHAITSDLSTTLPTDQALTLGQIKSAMENFDDEGHGSFSGVTEAALKNYYVNKLD